MAAKSDMVSPERHRTAKLPNSQAAANALSDQPGTAAQPADSAKKIKKRPAHLQLERLSAVSIRDTQLQTPIVEATISTQNTDVYRAVELKLVSGGLLTNDPIAFSADSKLFYLAKDNAIAVYNTENSEMVQNFSLPQAPMARVKPTLILAIVSGEGHNVYTFSADHRARLWNAETGELVHTWELGCRVEHAQRDPLVENRFFCASRRGAKEKYTIDRVTLDRDGVAKETLMRATAVVGLVVRDDARWVAAYSKFAIYLIHTGPGRLARHRWRMAEEVSTLAFVPHEPVLAVGDWRGRIMFWFCLDGELGDSDDRSVVRQPHHWHAHRVNTIAFTDGMMLSGGEEGVLVFWQLETGKRDYLPRLGSDILGIAVSPDQMRYAVTLRDNTVRVFSAMDRSLVSSLQGLKFAEHSAGPAGQQRLLRRLPFTTGLVVHPVTRALVLNGEPGHLQVFNHLADRHLASIEVAAFNRIAGSQPDLQAAQPHVDLVRYSSDGTWMATVDTRRGAARRESYLKFWRLDPSTQSYRLLSRVDNPHTEIRDIAFQPVRRGTEDLLCVSTGDHEFRVWGVHTVHQGAHTVWSSQSTGRYRGQRAHGAAFAADGSMFAVTFGGTVTLWDTSATLVGSLVASALVPALSRVAFIGHSCYLAAWSAERLDVWNILTGSVWWSQVMNIQDVFVHQRAALLCVAAYQIPESATASVLVFAPSSPNPLLALQHPDGVEAVALVPATSAQSHAHPQTENAQPRPDPLDGNTLVVLTPRGLINVYAAEAESTAFARAARELRTRPDLEGAARPMDGAVFSGIFGGSRGPTKRHESAGGQHVRAAMRLVRSAVQSAYAGAPHHVLPPVALLFEQFVQSQLPPRPTADRAAEAAHERPKDEGAEAQPVDAEMANSGPSAGSVGADLPEFFASIRHEFARAKTN
ncbi:quinon protein alcohol dehydrogenase-like superfamily [Coemansia spiralis]|nr:quinon protein alcohol dehydrogenase-like superfamily [Coemansia spiralis]